MSRQGFVTVRMFGALHTQRRQQGLEPTVEIRIPPGGCKASELARELALPMEKIEAVFVNHRAWGLDRTIQPGDQVAFVPTGIPGVERLLLGFYCSGRPGQAT